MIQPKTSDTEKVFALIQKLDVPLREIAGAVRQIILSADLAIAEQIKWNSPSFYYSGEMKPFNPKEYKRDIVVMNLRKGHVLLVFPTGAKVKDTSELLEGSYTDGRRLITFSDLNDVKNKEKGLKAVIKEWLKLVDR